MKIENATRFGNIVTVLGDHKPGGLGCVVIDAAEFDAFRAANNRLEARTMKTIDVSGYSADWVARALAEMKRDGGVALTIGCDAVCVTWRDKLDNETRLVKAAAKLKGHGK